MQIEKMKVSDLKYAPYNPRKIDDKELAKLKRSISEFGYVEPIVWNQRTGFVVGGNQRLKALRELGIEEVETAVKEAVENKKRDIGIIGVISTPKNIIEVIHDSTILINGRA